MIRILHVFGKLNMGGAESRIMDLYRNIDRTKIQFDFVVHGEETGFFEEEIRTLGGRVFRVPKYKVVNQCEYIGAWKRFILEHSGEFEMIQGHMTSTASIYLPVAKKGGIRTTIAHVRSAGVDPGAKGVMTRILRMNLANKAEYLFACSDIAAISAYGKKAFNAGKTTFIPNAINTELFRFNPKMRHDVREELNIENKFVIGHVGRFHYAKNHEYLLRVLKSFLEKKAAGQTKLNPVLMLVGDGPKMDEMKQLATDLGIMGNVLFLGSRSDAYRYYNAMDCFVYPSRYEGLPGTVIEAQASGLRCLISDRICEEVYVTDAIMGMSIDADESLWADKAIECAAKAPKEREKYVQTVSDAGFDIKTQSKKMEQFYLTGDLGVLTDGFTKSGK